jgi:hypothetical protein
MPRDVVAAATTAATSVMSFVGNLSLSVLCRLFAVLWNEQLLRKSKNVTRIKALVVVIIPGE